MNAAFRILDLPIEIQALVYAEVLGTNKVDVEVDKDGAVRTYSSRLLRVCKQMRLVILEACWRQELRLIYTVRSPAALTALISNIQNDSLVVPAWNTRVVIFSELEGVDLKGEEEDGPGGGPQVRSLFKAWRESFRGLPDDSSLKMVFFDFIASVQPRDGHAHARLVNHLSFILQRKSRGRARCRILGCKMVFER